MKKTITTCITLAAVAMMAQTAVAGDDIDAKKIFSKKCKMCHSLDKKKVGPAFNSMNKDAEILLNTIHNGRKMMPKFDNKLSEEEIVAMVRFIKAQQGDNPCAK